MKKFMILLIKGYRICISPLFLPTCRFHPTCSAYFIQALEEYGAVRGSFLGIKRILKCHPFHPGGYDPLDGGSVEDGANLEPIMEELN